MGQNEIDGLSVPKTDENEKLASTIDLYIGVFFDGTNNNKYQVMLGKMFRWREIYEKHKWELKRHFHGWNITKFSEVDMYTISKYPRQYWEEGEGKNIFTRSELEFIYFGYGDINNTSSSRYNTFIEEKSIATLNNDDINQVTAKPDDEKELEKLKSTAKNISNREEGNSWIKDKWEGNLTNHAVKGTPAQNVTYTNVAILESLYNCDNKIIDGKISEKHISMYIEGSGTDMQIESSKNTSHTVGHGVLGLGKGTGPSGAAAKVRKAVKMTERLLETFRSSDGQERRVKLHFDICGFSRGAACARMFCYVINPNKDDATKPYDEGISIINHPNDLELFTGSTEEFLKINTGKSSSLTIESKDIRNLLIADTVASIGVLYHDGIVLGTAGNFSTRSVINSLGGISKGVEMITHLGSRQVDSGTDDISMWGKHPYHYQNVDDYGLWSTNLAQNVVHICAMDEVRQNFALTDIQSSIKAKNGTEIFIPGCHTDIGGGAAIGMEGEKILNTGFSRYLTSYLVHQKSKLQVSNGLIKRISDNTLKEIGWLNIDSESAGIRHKTPTGRSNRKCDETHYSNNKANIVLYRHVYPGYSNIALNCFFKKTIGENVFQQIPPSYFVPKDLYVFYNDIIKKTQKRERYFVYPPTPQEYYELRRKYLHFSYNEQLLATADNILVNGPEFTEIEIEKDKKGLVNSRIIYKGEYGQNDEAKDGRIHMFDYGGECIWARYTSTEHFPIASSESEIQEKLPDELQLLDVFWIKDGMKIRFIPHQMDVTLIIVLGFVYNDEKHEKDNAVFHLNFEVPGTLYQNDKEIIITYNEIQGNTEKKFIEDLKLDRTVRDKFNFPCFYYKIENFSNDLSKVIQLQGK